MADSDDKSKKRRKRIKVRAHKRPCYTIVESPAHSHESAPSDTPIPPVIQVDTHRSSFVTSPGSPSSGTSRPKTEEGVHMSEPPKSPPVVVTKTTLVEPVSSLLHHHRAREAAGDEDMAKPRIAPSARSISLQQQVVEKPRTKKKKSHHINM
ncbi:cellulose synthase like D4 [Striga asiatica]|uniref:Cellulose synthase like D4 n=1 Tax=Striga asiatica TaxID=4170 RepID=A0A5A7P0L0_STRAF|nr:cellulose synthase like D4 [Striga asiatica]